MLHTFCMLPLIVLWNLYIKINHIFPFCICCILFVCFFWLYYEKCTSTLITYFQFVSGVYFLYTSSYCCVQKEYIKINHISCVYFLCIHQVYIRYNGVDLCTLFVYKLCTNHLHIKHVSPRSHKIVFPAFRLSRLHLSNMECLLTKYPQWWDYFDYI